MKGISLGMALPVRFGLALYSEVTSTVDIIPGAGGFKRRGC